MAPPIYDPLVWALLILGTAITLLSTVFYRQNACGGPSARALGWIAGPMAIALGLLILALN